MPPLSQAKRIQVVILAAGQGKRMHSALPKVLHPLGGRPLLSHVLALAHTLAPTAPPIVVCGHQAEQVQAAFQHDAVQWVYQHSQKGTADALSQAMPYIAADDTVLVLNGDVPLLTRATLTRLLAAHQPEGMSMLSAYLTQPEGYGRLLRGSQGELLRIVEEKDADASIRAIQEVNAGVYLFEARDLQQFLPKIGRNNAQQEAYLTDMITLGVGAGKSVTVVQPDAAWEIMGVNDRAQLAGLERIYQQQQVAYWLARGVSFADPARVDLRGEVSLGRDVWIDINVILAGKVVIADGCVIGAHSYIKDADLAQGVEIRSHSVIEGANIGKHCTIGPFARIRPGTKLEEAVHVGNFVEIKKTQVGMGSKVGHLSYLGDSQLGREVNIGAGTITCNYDGKFKHQTIIGDQAFIGSGTELVAPIHIGSGAVIGAGSTLTEDAPAHELSLARTPQVTVLGWKKKNKKSIKS